MLYLDFILFKYHQSLKEARLFLDRHCVEIYGSYFFWTYTRTEHLQHICNAAEVRDELQRSTGNRQQNQRHYICKFKTKHWETKLVCSLQRWFQGETKTQSARHQTKTAPFRHRFPSIVAGKLTRLCFNPLNLAIFETSPISSLLSFVIYAPVF